MYLLVMVLDDATRLNEVLSAWLQAGVRGVTVLESTGLNRILARHQPRSMFVGYEQLFGAGRIGHNTLFAVIESLDLAEAAVAETETAIGSLNTPQTGLVFALPVTKTWGLPEPYTPEAPPGG